MNFSLRSLGLLLGGLLAVTSCGDAAAGPTTAQSSESTETQVTELSAVQLSESTATLLAAQTDTFQALVPNGFIKIANGDGGFATDIAENDRFGRDHDSAGDVDGDGIIDLVVGARSDDDGPTSADSLTDAGAVYILFMNEDGTVRSHQKISALLGGFPGPLAEGSFFGYGVAGIGDYDGDGIPDIAASAPRQGGTGFQASVFILHLNRDGTVKSTVAATGIVAQGLSAVGDLDGDGRVDLVAADPNGGVAGRIRILFFDEDSELRADDVVIIGADEGGFSGDLTAGDGFGGRESALLGDLDSDGLSEIAVGAFTSDGGQGAVWILSLDNQTHQVIAQVKLAPGLGNFGEALAITVNENGTSGAHFGHAIVATGDLDGDGVPDLITSANQFENGVGYVVYLNADKTVKGFSRISEDEGGFALPLEQDERFGRSISIVRHADGTMTVNFGAGAGLGQGGAIYALTFDVDPTPPLVCNGLEVTVDLALGESPTAGDDVIRGTAGADTIDGLGGNDTICALQGDDSIDGGDGFDRVFAGAGDDTIDGGIGNDTLVGGLGDDSISGGNGNDRLQGGGGADILSGDGGFDVVYGGNGNDTIQGGTHADDLSGNLGRDTIFGDGGDDIIRGGAWLDTMDGGAGNDGCTLTDPSGNVEIRIDCESGVFGS